MQHVLDALAPVLDALVGVPLDHRARAEAALAERLDGRTMQRISRTVREAHAARSLTPREASPTLRFGRLAKASEATRGFTVDVVDMAGAGAGHTHPEGEVSWCIPMAGSPRFEGVAEGWAVMPAGSRHIPEVTGGRMLIVYFLPDGAMVWDPPKSTS